MAGEHQGAARPTVQDRRALVAVGLGMAFFWQLFRYTNLANMLPSYASALVPFDAASTVSPVTLFYAVTLVFGLLLLIAGARGARAARTPFVVGVGLLSSLLSCAMVVLKGADAPLTPVHIGLDGLTLVVLSFAFVLQSVAWVRVCRLVARQDPKRLVYVLCLSSLASFVVSLAFSLQIPRFEALVVISPACSALCLLFAPRVREADPEAASSVPGAPANEQGSVAAQVPRSVVAVLVLLLALIVCIKGVSDLLYVGSDGSTLYVKHFITVAELAVIMSVCLFAAGMSRFAFLGWAVLVGGVVSGLVILFLFPDSPSAFQFGLGTIAAAKTCLELFMFIVVACTRRDDAGRAILLLLVVPETVSYLVGYGVLPAAFLAVSASAESWIGVLALAAGATIAVSTFLIMSSLALKGLNEGVRDEVAEGAEGEADETDDELRFDEIAARFDLTKRERETAYLFFKGYSAKRIAELHYVSLNTTQSHLRSVYKKMDVHSRQDLIDLVDGDRS